MSNLKTLEELLRSSFFVEDKASSPISFTSSTPNGLQSRPLLLNIKNTMGGNLKFLIYCEEDIQKVIELLTKKDWKCCIYLGQIKKAEIFDLESSIIFEGIVTKDTLDLIANYDCSLWSILTEEKSKKIFLSLVFLYNKFYWVPMLLEEGMVFSWYLQYKNKPTTIFRLNSPIKEIDTWI